MNLKTKFSLVFYHQKFLMILTYVETELKMNVTVM